jgi:GNAT superfamily N-acetyltransferase
MSQFSIQQSLVTNELTTRIDAGFRQHGIDAIGIDMPIDRVAFVASAGDTFAGAVTAHVLWGTLHIRHMFIEAQYRRQGLGKTLMERALDYGETHGCTVSFVDTMSFQALGFYQRLGFVHEFTRTGFAHNTVLYYLKKELFVN